MTPPPPLEPAASCLEFWQSRDADPLVNLALEEWLFRNLPPDTARLFFCINTPAVIIGRNQNPWRECNLATLAPSGVQFARRISGGGTVYQDTGNLNWSLMQPRARHDAARNLRWVCTALSALGFAPTTTPRHAIEVAGRKVSGTAFMYTGHSVMHHGTLLLHADLARLRACLAAEPRPDIVSTAVHSVPSPVINLGELQPGLMTAAVIAAILEAAPTSLGLCSNGTVRQLSHTELLNDHGFMEILAKARSWEWNFGRTPAFRQRLPCPGSNTDFVELHVVDGLVAEIMPATECEAVPQVLASCGELRSRLLNQRYHP